MDNGLENLEDCAMENLKKWYIEEREKLEEMELFKLNLQTEVERLKAQIIDEIMLPEKKDRIRGVRETEFHLGLIARKDVDSGQHRRMEDEVREKWLRTEKRGDPFLNYKYQFAKVSAIEKYLEQKGWTPIKEGGKILFKEK